MAMNERLVVPYDATISASSATNPTNVLNDRLGRVASFTGGGGYVVLDLGSVRAVDTVALLATDATAASNWSVTAFNSAGDAASRSNALYERGAAAVWASADAGRRLHRQGLLLIPALTAARYWRIDGTAMNIGRVVVGQSFTAADTMDIGYSFKVVDLGEYRRSANALDNATLRGKVLEYSWTWSWMSEAEARGAMLDVLAFAGTTRNIMCVLNPDATDLHNVIGFGRIVEEVEPTNVAGGVGNGMVNAYEAKLRLQSKLILNL